MKKNVDNINESVMNIIASDMRGDIELLEELRKIDEEEGYNEIDDAWGI